MFQPLQRRPSNGLRVLAIEQDPGLLEVFRVISRMAGITDFHAARTGEEARTLTRQHQPDLVITDLVVPRGDGLTLLDELRDLSDGPLPTIVVGRKDQLAQLRTLLGSREDVRLLAKPFLPDQLLSALRAEQGEAAHAAIA